MIVCTISSTSGKRSQETTTYMNILKHSNAFDKCDMAVIQGDGNKWACDKNETSFAEFFIILTE